MAQKEEIPRGKLDANFAATLEAILACQFEENKNAGHGPKFFGKKLNTARNAQFDNACAAGGWTHYLALKVTSLAPLGMNLISEPRAKLIGQLVENVTKIQDDLITEMGPGVIQKSAEPMDLHIKLLLLKEESPDSLNILFATLKSLPISGVNQVEFGGILPSKQSVTIAMFSEALESLINHLTAHISKSKGVKCGPVPSGLSLAQPGLFQLDVLDVLRPSEYKKPSTKARFGKYDWGKIHIVNAKTDAVAGEIGVDVHLQCT